MQGHVAEIICDRLNQALPALREPPLRFAEVALYGSTIHVIGENLDAQLPVARERLQSLGIAVESAEVIAPSLEDVFITRLRSAERGTPLS